MWFRVVPHSASFTYAVSPMTRPSIPTDAVAHVPWLWMRSNSPGCSVLSHDAIGRNTFFSNRVLSAGVSASYTQSYAIVVATSQFASFSAWWNSFPALWFLFSGWAPNVG